MSTYDGAYSKNSGDNGVEVCCCYEGRVNEFCVFHGRIKEQEKGLYSKYTVIDNRTGEEVKGDCFILKPEKDEAARKAIIAYADATDNKELANDLRKWVNYGNWN